MRGANEKTQALIRAAVALLNDAAVDDDGDFVLYAPDAPEGQDKPDPPSIAALRAALRDIGVNA